MSAAGEKEDGGAKIIATTGGLPTFSPQPQRRIVDIDQCLDLSSAGWAPYGVSPNPAPLYSPKNSLTGSGGSMDHMTSSNKVQGKPKTGATNQETTSDSGSGLRSCSSPTITTTPTPRSASQTTDTQTSPTIIVDGSGKSKLSASAAEFDPSSMKNFSDGRLKLGGSTCSSCAYFPSYLIVPCRHKICAACIKPLNMKLTPFAYCGVCGVNVRSISGFTTPEKLSGPSQNQLNYAPQNVKGFQQNAMSFTSPQGGAFGRIVGATNKQASFRLSNNMNPSELRVAGPHFPSQMPHEMPLGPLGPSPIPNYSPMHRSGSQNTCFTPSPYQCFSQMQQGAPNMSSGMPVNAGQQNWQQGALYANSSFQDSTDSQDSGTSFASQVPLPYYMPAGQTPTQSFASPVIQPQSGPQPIPNPLAGAEVQSNPTANPQYHPGIPPHGEAPAWNNHVESQPSYAHNQPVPGWRDAYIQGQMSQNGQHAPPGHRNGSTYYGNPTWSGSINRIAHGNTNANNHHLGNGGYGTNNGYSVNNSYGTSGGQNSNGDYNTNSHDNSLNRFDINAMHPLYNQVVQNHMYQKKLQDSTATCSDKGSGRQSVDSYTSNDTYYPQSSGAAQHQESASSSRRQSVSGHNGSYASRSDIHSEKHQNWDKTEDAIASSRKVRNIQKYNMKTQPVSASKVAGEVGRSRTPLESPPTSFSNAPQTAPQNLGKQKQPQSTPGLRRRGDSVASLRGAASVTKKPPPAFNLPTVVDSPVSDENQVDSTTSGVLARLNEDDPFTSTQRSNPDPFVVAPPMNGPLVPYGEDIPNVSKQLRLLTINGLPKVDAAFNRENFPFCETGRQAGPATYGVVRISNIPYSVTRAEVLAFLGRNAKIASEFEYEPVHIVMERVTSKTMDAFVEFVNESEAINAVDRYAMNRAGGRGGRLGQRHVELEVVSQAYLMKELFPKARNVRWNGARPEIYPVEPGEKYNSGFKGFMISEEMVMLVKHVETPQRSPFSKECPQRPFECLISTLYKFPWYMVDHITLKQRTQIYDATVKLVTLLYQRVQTNSQPLILNMQLLKRVLMAGLKCAGFTQAQKAEIRLQAGFTDFQHQLAPYAEHWLFQTIGPKKGAEFDTIMYFQALIREAQNEPQQALSLAEQAARGDEEECLNVFGPVFFNYPPNVQDMTMGAIAKIEWNVVETLLRRALPE